MLLRKALHPSSSNESQAFFLLNEKIQRWVWAQGWTDLRDAQERAIPSILTQNTDVIIAAATATGKTEAAFLPICSILLSEEHQDACVVYLSPLKALINDQFSRMEQLCERLDIPVYPWHGDISGSKKKKFLKEPSGFLLITPESLESLFVNHGTAIPKIFDKLLYVVVDELHSFIGSERGQQLQSLLQRIELAVKKNIPRIGLSATIGDMNLAAQFLRPNGDTDTEMIISTATGQELQLILRGYVKKPPPLIPGGDEKTDDEQIDGSLLDIGDNLFKTLRGSSNLIFANSRNRVEYFADFLRRRCEENQLPNEFWPHHGSLSKNLREDAESAIKDKTRPVSIVCTSTLEMGIDIGSVSSIAQVGVPPSVASLRQRLGRSGRRGEPAVLRIYLQEEELNEKSSFSDCLRASLVQSIAMVRLLLAKWYEPPSSGGFHLSTLVQQLLSLIAQYGGVTAAQAYNALCRKGAFPQVSQQMFVDFLRCLGGHQLIMQASDGLLLHGQAGERIVNHYSFYTAFTTHEEYRLVSGDRILGTLPIDRPLTEGALLIFGGRRWIVLEIDQKKKIISLKPSTGGKAPVFGGQAGWIHDRIRQEMFDVYTEEKIPVFLDPQAKKLLLEARENFRHYKLAEKRILSNGNTAHICFWRGDRVLDTLVAMLRAKGISAANEGVSIAISGVSLGEISQILKILIQEGAPDTYELAASVANKAVEKYDFFLSDQLLNADYASLRLDSEGALNALKSFID
ncbi:MAG: DEAD/DEAH box helicase [Candidatus Vecturithrix sp.]|jgi:ATP-dependent Lhr-like helicase|nr:DEAD/DEAH box helicase [Candidatus Vecturithrix sp.]